MFTEKGQRIIDAAKDRAQHQAEDQIKVTTMLAAMVHDREACILLSEISGLAIAQLEELYPPAVAPLRPSAKLPISAHLQSMIKAARDLATRVPDRQHPGLIDVRHLVCAMGQLAPVCALIKMEAMSQDRALSFLAEWQARDDRSPMLEELFADMQEMRTKLLQTVFGQDHAVHDFVEGLFNAEIVAGADVERKTPRAIFVFAGPPGVGKTFLAETGAAWLQRPFKRFDMSGFSASHQIDQLAGTGKMYQGSQPGLLTEFVEKNPQSILLFDEIEKAHLKIIHLFLQILDQGNLLDNYHERKVAFRDTVIIFTTNAAKKLYENPNSSGVHRNHAGFHRQTILDALASEKDPSTGQPLFPSAICSRLATGYPILFNHLGIHELDRVVQAEFGRLARLFELQHYKRITFDPLIPLCLVLKEGVHSDARTMRAQAEKFAKSEIYAFGRLYKTHRLEQALATIDGIHFSLDGAISDYSQEIARLFEPQRPFRILLAASSTIAGLIQQGLPQIEWVTSSSAQQAMALLGRQRFDLVLLDLRLEQREKDPLRTGILFDHVPLAAKELQQGQELLRMIHERLPDLPIYLLAFAASGAGEEEAVDEELFHACVRAGGARGFLAVPPLHDSDESSRPANEQLSRQLFDVLNRLYRESAVQEMGRGLKVLQFDTAPTMDGKKRLANIRLRNLRLARAIASSDVGEVMEEVERPQARFSDVFGAESAKEELQFFIDAIKDPRRYAALGIKPPRGVLLYGPPGTGKTMLARAMAGESGVAFISASASSFVTIWQGSGPQSVRDLFARARKYAPAIVFIDEIDAIGKVRTGAAGSAEASENTLNALLTEMDGFTSPSPDRPVFVLAATNFAIEAANPGAPERSARTLDPALVRRFSRTILVDLPDRAARQAFLEKRLLGNSAYKVTREIINLIAERSAGMAIANLELIIETAGRSAAKQAVRLTAALLEEAFETVQYGEKKRWDAAEIQRTARHEAGHTLLYWLAGHLPSYVTIVSRGNFGGYMARSAAEMEEQHLLTRQQLLADIRVKLGGRAAELLYYGDEEGLSTGAAGDLEAATAGARSLVCRYGMDAEFGPLVTPELLQYNSALASAEYKVINDKARQILKEQMKVTGELLQKHRPSLEAIAKALLEKERLTRREVEEVLAAVQG